MSLMVTMGKELIRICPTNAKKNRTFKQQWRHLVPSSHRNLLYFSGLISFWK